MTEEPKDASQSPSRRDFIKQSAVAAAAFMIVPRHVLGGKGYRAPSDMLTVASVGCGGKGQSDIFMFNKSGKANIAYLCDVDEKNAATTFKNFPNAIRYKDWRELFDNDSMNFDAVSGAAAGRARAGGAEGAGARGGRGDV